MICSIRCPFCDESLGLVLPVIHEQDWACSCGATGSVSPCEPTAPVGSIRCLVQAIEIADSYKSNPRLDPDANAEGFAKIRDLCFRAVGELELVDKADSTVALNRKLGLAHSIAIFVGIVIVSLPLHLALIRLLGNE